jgi:hypothetical protein
MKVLNPEYVSFNGAKPEALAHPKIEMEALFCPLSAASLLNNCSIKNIIISQKQTFIHIKKVIL